MHPEGCPALYAVTTMELAVLATYLHTEADQALLVLVAVDLLDVSGTGADVASAELPQGRDDLDDGGSATDFGTVFLHKCQALYMRVPSVIVGEGANLVIQTGASGV